MYLDAMTAIQDHLIRKTQTGGYTYTSELQPERHENGEMCAPPLIYPNQLLLLPHL